jgi:GNAT superfamily N-acetyltransferase
VSLNVRLAALEEAALVREIMLAAYAEHEGALPVESGAHAESVEEVQDKMRAGGAVVAEDAGQPVGSAQFTPADDHVYVGRVAVLPGHRRRGVASAIMRFLENVTLDLGRDAIRVGVRYSLPDNVGLYESLGYEAVSTEPHPRGPDRVVTMVKQIR